MYTTHMKAKNTKNTGRSYHQRVLDARESLAKWNQEREAERKANPVNWNEVIKDYYKK